ncbi:hypothetical protein [Symbiopectobacterium sp.]|uniref:hypothetical protein n=1 Tax=Symbiopectobacterium sp. TaxID=2952789 RepID=UPI003F68590C
MATSGLAIGCGCGNRLCIVSSPSGVLHTVSEQKGHQFVELRLVSGVSTPALKRF